MNTSYGTAEQRLLAEQSNARLIEIIRAEFVCFDSASTLLCGNAPEFPRIAPHVRAMSIPPYAGKFSGYLNVFLTRQPNDDEKAELRDAASALASDIFDRTIRAKIADTQNVGAAIDGVGTETHERVGNVRWFDRYPTIQMRTPSGDVVEVGREFLGESRKKFARTHITRHRRVKFLPPCEIEAPKVASGAI